MKASNKIIPCLFLRAHNVGEMPMDPSGNISANLTPRLGSMIEAPMRKVNTRKYLVVLGVAGRLKLYLVVFFF